MTKYLIFSDKIRLILKSVELHLFKGIRFLKIFLKRDSKLKKKSLGYYKYWHFSNAYLWLNFEFENAVYFRIGEYESCDFSKQIVLDLETIENETLRIEVFGLLQKTAFDVNINKVHHLNSESFKVKTENINIIDFVNQKQRITIPKIRPSIEHPSFGLKQISVKKRNSEMSHKCFIIHDYL